MNHSRLLLITALAGAAGAQVRITSLEPTVLFPNREPLRQVAIMQVLNEAGGPLDCQVGVRVAGGSETTGIRVPAGPSRHRILVPEISAPAGLDLELRGPGGEILAAHRQQWQPQRRWKVYLMKSSHEDLGYEKYIYEKQHDVANYIDLARDHSGQRDNGRRGYHYIMEHLLFQRNYIEERGEPAWRELVEKHIQTGRLGLIGTVHGVHAHWMDYEELARLTYPGRREAKDRFGLDLKTFLIVDNPSFSWSGCQAIASAGYRYLARWGQEWRTGGNNDYQTTKVPALFWWVAPDGKSKVLYAWRSHYGQAFWFGQSRGYGGLVEAGADNVNQLLKNVENGALGPYPYDALVNPEYTDHEIPFPNGGALAEWARRYRYPDIRDAHPEEFFEYVEGKYGSTIPSLKGDLNNFSGDYATIDPQSQGWKRRAARVLPLAEGIGTIASALNPAFLAPSSLIERTFTRIFDYDEHSWPTLPVANDFQLFNAQWIKQREGERALEGANNALEISVGEIGRRISTGGSAALVVFNPLAHTRTDLVSTMAKFDGLEDAVTGGRVTVERLANGEAIFLAQDVPAFGYKVFRTVAGGTAEPAKALTATAGHLTNQFYEIRFDPKTGSILSIYDKELKRELVDSDAPRRFNELVYVHKDRPPDFYQRPKLDVPGDFEYSPAAAQSLRGRRGPMRAEMVARIEDPKLGGAVTQTVMLYDGLKRIDIINDLRGIRAMHSDRHEDRYRDNIYYAFPVKVENFEARAESAGGVVRPYKDQLRWGSHDYLMANRWVDVSNSTFGVTMAPREAQTVSFGEVRYNKFSIDYQPSVSHLYSYAWSNRMASLLTLNAEDANATLHYSFTSHAGDWDAGPTTRFGWAVASPLAAWLLPAGQQGPLPADAASFVSVKPENVQLVTLKPSEQPGRGYILRLVETEGKAADVTVEFSRLPAGSAMECDLVENDRGPVKVEGRAVRLQMGPYAFATIRLSSGHAPAAVAQPTAEALSDSSVLLRWRDAGGAGYNIFRSEDPKAPATAYTLAGRTVKPEFRDQGLKLDTAYYYHVAAVSAANLQGPVSPQVSVHTSPRNTSPPPPVDELGIVRRAKDRLVVYWRKSPDPDVARFLIFRGERADFDTKSAAPAAVVRPSGYFLETYLDRGLTPGKTYYYRVLAEDWAGNRQTESSLAQAATPAY